MAAAILNHVATAEQSLTGRPAQPKDNSTTGTNDANQSGDAGSNSATISANDFLTLLVTEMQNQDPTANMDPNEYINQLVQVNSLEQLISINQTLSTDLGGSAASAYGVKKQIADTVPGASDAQPACANLAATMQPLGAGELPMSKLRASEGNLGSAINSVTAQAAGNLSVPRTNAAAQSVGHALDGSTRAHAAARNSPGRR